jgi:hypothetical protein
VDETQDAPVETPAAPEQPKRKINYREHGLKLANRCIERARTNSVRKARDRRDWQNCLMYHPGESQWMIWDGQGDRFVPRGTDPELGGIPAWVPRCSSNVFGNKIDGIAAILNQSEPAKETGPGSDDDADRAAAEVAKEAIPVLFKEIGYERDRAQIHKLITLTSIVGYLVYCDNDVAHGTAPQEVVLQQCQDCQQLYLPHDVIASGEECPDCGGETQDAIDPRTGMPVVETVDLPKGKMCGEIINNGELSLPDGARVADANRLPYILAHTRMATESIFRAWPNAKEILGDLKGGDRSRGDDFATYADALNGLVGGAVNSNDAAKRGPVVYRLWHDPIEDDDYYLPHGLYIVLVDDQVLHAGPLPFKDEDGRYIKNIQLRQFVAGTGSAYGKPPADELVPLQIQRNIVESLGDLILMHEAAPTRYVPLSVTFESEPSGVPGETNYYRSVDGQKPTHVDGKGPPPALAQRIEAIDRKFDELSKLNAVLQGERPEGGDITLGEVEMLREQGQGAFREPIDSLIQFEEDLARLVLRIGRETIWTHRFIKIHGENGRWDVKQFLGADLDGRVDIYIDRASAWPKSPLLQMKRTEMAIEKGILPPPADDPELQGKLLQQLDLAGLVPSMDADRRQIARELDVWKTATSPEQIAEPDPLVQNLKRHFALKQAFLKTEEAEAIRNDPEKAGVYDAMRAHLQLLQMAGNPQPASSLNALVGDGILQPGTGAPVDPMQDLVAQGVIAPAPAIEKGRVH